MYSKSRFALLSLAVALVVAAGFTNPANAGTVISSGDLPVSGTYYDSIAGEEVVVTGTVHLETLVTLPDATYYLVYSSVQGSTVGQTSGNQGFINLASWNAFAFPRPIPTLNMVLTGVGDPDRPVIVGSVYNAHPLFIVVTLNFAISDGKLQSGRATLYPFDTIVVPCIDCN